MNKISFHNYTKIWIAFLAFTLMYVSENKLAAQDCFTLFGPSGEPAGGLDYKLCSGFPGNVTLDAFAAGSTYAWSTGATTSSVSVTAGGIYTVSISNGSVVNACILSFNVVAYPNPVVNLGNDTSFCSGDTVILNATPGMPDYTWSDGVTLVDSLIVTTPDTYSVTISDTNLCIAWDSVIVTENPLPTPNIGGPFSACPGDSVTLDAGAGYATYLWSDGSGNQTLETDIVGNYDVTVTDANGCQNTDGTVFFNDTIPVVNLGPNDSLCDGGVKVLNAGAGPINTN